MELYSSQILELVKQLATLKKEYFELSNKVKKIVNALESLFTIKNEEVSRRLGFSFNIRTRVNNKPIRFVKRYWSKKIHFYRGRDDHIKAWVFLIDNIDKIVENIERQYIKHQKGYLKTKKDSDAWADLKWRDKLKGEKLVLDRLKLIQRTIHAGQVEITKFGKIVIE